MISKFNIRVYGILINQQQEILLVNEQIGDFKFTKFPGGGMELGEGTIECLKREFIEEINLPIEIENHFYTTDFFQPSAFKNSDQLIAIYYKVKANTNPIEINLMPFEIIENNKIEILHFNWVHLNKLNPNMLTFPIDKKVCEMILSL
ncbi:MAG: NUDIX hydrolase [Bacteroidota bacterium]|jgi:8-oxo-dGTP pyrophosphatase MutT (NUDIX family)